MASTEVPEQLTVRGVVIELDPWVATVVVGEEQEEWAFPRHLLPEGVEVDSVVLLSPAPYGFEAVGLAGRTDDTLEARMSRGVNRRRLDRIA